jgi:hypothetical protein
MTRTIALLALTAAVIAGLVYFGVVRKEDVERLGRKTKADVQRGVQEALDGGDAGQPAGIAAAKKCRENLKALESAKRAVAESRGTAVGAVSWSDVLRHMNLSSAPRCPAGGEYSLRNLGQLPLCSVGSNGTADKTDDHIISNW